MDFTQIRATFTLPNFYDRLKFREGLSSTLQPGEASRSHNFVFGGVPGCTFRRFTGVKLVANYEERDFNQPGSPILGRWFECQGSSLVPLGGAANPSYTIEGVGSDYALFSFQIPLGVNPVGGNFGFVSFGMRQGGMRVFQTPSSPSPRAATTET